MKKTTTVLLALLIVGIVSASLAFAYGGSFSGQGQGTHYQDMQKIMSTGTYSDLVAYRQSTGTNIMPWVQNEQDFALAQQMHSKMTQWRQSNGVPSGQGFGRGGGCPMMNDGDGQ
jgi:hypothetical protein